MQIGIAVLIEHEEELLEEDELEELSVEVALLASVEVGLVSELYATSSIDKTACVNSRSIVAPDEANQSRSSPSGSGVFPNVASWSPISTENADGHMTI